MNSVLFFKFFGGLFAIMNPLIGIPVFLSLTSSYKKPERIRVAVVTAIAVFTILVTSVYSGEAILKFFGIGIGAFEAFGGVVVGMIAISLLQSQSSFNSGKEASGQHVSPALVPLAMPLIAGPGAITKTIAFATRASGMSDVMALISAILAVCLLTVFIFSAAQLVQRVLGHAGISSISKIMGLLLGAIAAEMLMRGIKEGF